MNNKLILPSGFALRLAGLNDEPFLYRLFCSSRPELTLLPLPQVQLEQLIRQQYEWQQKSYTNQYPQIENWMIEVQFETVGKVMLSESANLVHIIDFIIVPDWRGRGVGSSILAVLKNYVETNSCILRLSVDHHNTEAKRLYQRQGFVVSQSSDTHEQLIWSPIN